MGSPDGSLARLQEAGRLDLGDFMSFEVRVDPRHPEIAGDGVQYEGQRFRAECRLAGMLYGQASPNTRVKDLPDLALLEQIGPRDARRARAAVPDVLLPQDTQRSAALVGSATGLGRTVAAMAEEDALPWSSLEEVTAAARAFLDPVLGSDLDASWDPATWSWSAG